MVDHLVSVNITTFNRSELLKRCLNSVTRQTYQNLEVIVVDDYSSDDTRDVVENYMEEDKRIFYRRHHRNMGNAAARNTAFAMCKGDFVAFLDDDDEWIDENKIAKQIDCFLSIEDEDAPLILCGNVRIFSNENDYFDKALVLPSDISSHLLKTNSLLYNSTVLVRRSLIELIDGFDLNQKKGIDSDFYRTGVLVHNCDVHIMPDILVGVHEYGDRMTTKMGRHSLEEALIAHTNVLEKFWDHYRTKKAAMFFRLKRMFGLYIRLFFLTKNPVYIFRSFYLLKFIGMLVLNKPRQYN